MLDHKLYLTKALKLAEEALEKNTYPIGCIIVNSKGEILAESHNESFTANDATAHAEILCIRKAGKLVLSKFEPEPTFIYSSLEPCFGCGFFTRYTNIKTMVWALSDGYKGGIDFLKVSEKLSKDFEDTTFVAEPYEDLKQKSRELMYKYLVENKKFEAAEKFKN